jgi:hypothetical protein
MTGMMLHREWVPSEPRPEQPPVRKADGARHWFNRLTPALGRGDGRVHAQVELVLFSDEGHGFRKIGNRIKANVEVVRWFVKYLR